MKSWSRQVVGADPHPRDRVRGYSPECPVMVATRTVNDPRFPFRLLKRREGDADRVAIALNSSPPVFVRPAVTSETAPGSGHSQVISRSRRPLAKSPRGRFVFGLSEQEVQPAGRRIPIQLFIPPGLFKRTKPRDEAAVIFRRQAVDGGLDLFNPVHVRSLALSSRPRTTSHLRRDGVVPFWQNTFLPNGELAEFGL